MGDALACVILAAGGSTRMGRPKALLALDGEPLIRRAVRLARGAGFGDIRVVLRPEDLEVRQVLGPLKVQLLEHSRWAEGMGGSIAFGVGSLKGDMAGVLLLACDQPAVDEGLLRGLVSLFEGPASRVCSAYAGTLGIPALFGSRWFPRLRALQGDRGAKTLLQGGDVKALAFPGGAFDLDRPEDLEAWMELKGGTEPGSP